MNFILTTPFLPLLFLFFSLTLTASSTSFLQLGKFKSKELLKSKNPPFFFFFPILKKFFPKHEWENLYFSISISKHIFQLAYAVTAFFYGFSKFDYLKQTPYFQSSSKDWDLILLGLLIIVISLFLDYFFRLFTILWKRPLLRVCAPFASLSLTCLFPVVGILLFFTRGLLKKIQIAEETTKLLLDKTKIRELIAESEIQHLLDPTDQKLIHSFINFKERVAKEIMVPRVDLFALPSDTPIQSAAKIFAQEGYSRIPIYEETLDTVIGVVLYKDLLHYFSESNANLNDPLRLIAKPVLYAPENKKIALLLQEFRTSQIHMAIIVDEYGGTEGIVTIEDILEELVGEIEDEYDIGESRQYWEAPGGGWIVDAKMNIHDIEDELGVEIPQNPEYETIGGYIFHYAGSIPKKGWLLSHDNFDLEVLSSNDRSIKKIKITPRSTQNLD